MIGNNEKSFEDDFGEMGLSLREQSSQEADDLERELNLYRSESAPPTVEGSLSAIGGLFNHGVSIGGGGVSQIPDLKFGNGFLSEEELRSDPSYSSYYYSNVNLNPRLPPPLLSKEDWRFAQRLQGGSSVIGDRRKVSRNESSNGGRTQFQMPPGFSSRKQEMKTENKMPGGLEWDNNALIGMPGFGLGSKQKSLVDIFQDGLTCSSYSPDSRSAFGDNSGVLGSSESDLARLNRDFTPTDSVQTSSNIQGSSSVQHVGAPASYSYAAALGSSISRSSTPDPQCIARAPSPCPGPIGGNRAGNFEKRAVKSPSPYNEISHTNESDLVSAWSGMKFSNGMVGEDQNFSSGTKPDDRKHFLFGIHEGENDAGQHSFSKDSEHGLLNMASNLNPRNFIYPDSGIENSGGLDFTGNISRQTEVKKSNFPSSKPYRKGSPAGAGNGGGGFASRYQHIGSPTSPYSSFGLGGYPMSPISGQPGSPNLPPLFGNAAASALAMPGLDARVLGASSFNADAEHNLNRIGNQMAGGILQSPFVDPLYLQYLRPAEYGSPQIAGLMDPTIDSYMRNSHTDAFQKGYLGDLFSPHNSQYAKASNSSPHGYLASPTVGFSYPTAGMPGSPMWHGEYHIPSLGAMRNFSGSVFGPWHLDSMNSSFGSSLLEEFKSNKTRDFELSEIGGHLVEFSVDQYGSRFIQQKLETATIEEKNMVFEEIFPEALTLMTDVFGNYVIQKFFEHGMPDQRREMAGKLFGSVLTLSLQMYGCRVIQKAIEVVDVDQKIKMVKELDGHVMRCVHDQNGNHVIQKCVECVPEERIQFIITIFFDQVVTLSTHPYGCRVIQRVLEHCKDEKTQSKMMTEILGSVSMLAQDQYGNYVVQHVLEHGKPEERSVIIQELAGKIVQMSQQKFASNVVEKCLAFGDPSERLLLVNEMLGTTDENEPLQAMMKDQFANYVVQKVLETCSDQQRELILSRIKIHLTALKKYTYGKHIVNRVEKLVTAGERRMAIQPSNVG